MNNNYEDYSEQLVEMVRNNEESLGLTRKYFRNIILSALFIIIPSFLHLGYADNIMVTIFISILLIGLTIIFWIITFINLYFTLFVTFLVMFIYVNR